MSAGRIYFFILAPPILVFAVWQTVKQLRFFRKSVPARGQIIGLEPRLFTYKRKRTYYYPIVEFIGEKGERRTFVGGLGSSWKRESLIGRHIDVRYCPGEDAKTAKVWTFWSVVFPPMVIFAVGAGLLWLAIQGGEGFETRVRVR